MQEITEIRKVTTNFRSHKAQDAPTDSERIEESVNKENLSNFFPLDDNDALQAMEEKLENRVFQEDVVHKYFCTI